jgi:hypothetical protein
MARWITWIADPNQLGWACSDCSWTYPAPTLLSDPEAKKAYDRLAQAKFAEHDCAAYSRAIAEPEHDPFGERVRRFIKVGYKPKDAVELVLQDISLEHRHEPKVLEKAKADAERFMRNLREGKI